MSVCTPKHIYGTPQARAMVRTAAKVPIRKGSKVRYMGRGHDAYWGKEMVVVEITLVRGYQTTLFLKRPRTRPTAGFAISCVAEEVLAL